MNTLARRAAGLALVVATAGCNLIFGVGDPVLDTTASGGGGASTVGTGASGTGGGEASCVDVVCDDGNLCTFDSCNDKGECAAKPNDGAMPEQVVGDCVERECMGGVLQLVPLDTDVPADDGNPCTSQTCVDGQAVNAFELTGTSCNGMGTCDGAGLCSTCTSPSQCGLDTECAVFTCNGQCGVGYQAMGTVIRAQTGGDCVQLRCTGSSAVPEPQPFDTDIEDDGNDCTEDSCMDAAPWHPPYDGGTPCSLGVCDGTGLCKACFDMTQCVGDLDGPLCLTGGVCGCKQDMDCREKFGRLCLVNSTCGCNKDTDCNFSGSAGPSCDPQSHKCGPKIALPG